MTDLTAGRGWLNPAPAASIARIDRALGHPLQITEAGRSWAQQKAHWDTYQSRGWPIALHPDTPSVHQLGAAIDSDEAQKHLNLMTEHGWIRTVYRNGRLAESWHFEYAEHRDQHINDAAPAATVPEEDDMPITIIQKADSNAAKSLYDVKTGRAIRAISRDENTAFRKAAAGTVVYITLSDAEYAERGGK